MEFKYRYSLDRSSKKVYCPQCGQKRFVLYRDNETGEYLRGQFGRCDREDRCGYYRHPDQKSGEKKLVVTEQKNNELKNGPIDYLPFDIMEKSVTRHHQCDLFPFLTRLFRKEIANWLCNQYFVGTNKDGNTTFWQVDINGNIRQCKIIQYLSDGHRNKEAAILFAGKKILKNKDAYLKQCFFGEFLLSLDSNKGKSVAIVESEKTALIASVYFKNVVWLATGGKNGASWSERNVCKVLSGREVILFPDVKAFSNWKAKGLLIAENAGCKVQVSDLLENRATEQDRDNGLDLADYLLRIEDESGLALTDHEYPVIFDNDYN
ncbi:MAG TPA: DUF6371 domain-containing protein [Chitinophagaceae bacterium]|nr:DUF6371 domain-containing protein [Chitinophagaceae bacterium]